MAEKNLLLLQAKVAEFENSTIVKQRHELNLLIEELKDRDSELNKMVESHRQQLTNWEKDRRTILAQDEKLSRLEGTHGGYMCEMTLCNSHDCNFYRCVRVHRTLLIAH